MPNAAAPATDRIIGTSLIVAETVAAELREQLLSALKHGSHYEIHEAAKAIFDEYESLLVENVANADLLAWLTGFDQVAQKLPRWAIEQLGGFRGRPPGPPPAIPGLLGFDDAPELRFPLIEKAAADLFRREILTPDDFAAASSEIRSKAFTVAHEAREDVLERIRDALAETTREGASLPEFKERLGEDLQKSFIGPGHLENVYRTNIQTAFTAGHDELADHPIVEELFPFRVYEPIKDARCRQEHLALGAHSAKLGIGPLGLEGTNIYWASDPFWDVFSIPWDYQCRCSSTLITIESAARRGLTIAKEWLRTGRRPLVRESRLPFIPFRPPAGFGRAA